MRSMHPEEVEYEDFRSAISYFTDARIFQWDEGRIKLTDESLMKREFEERLDEEESEEVSESEVSRNESLRTSKHKRSS